MPSVALLFYRYAKPLLTEKQTLRNETPIIYKIKYLHHNGKVIKFLTETESLLIFYFRGNSVCVLGEVVQSVIVILVS